MTARTFGTPTPYVEHVPGYGVETDGNGVKHQVELPGYVYFGFEVDGVKVPLGSKATAGLVADIERAKADAKSDADTTAAATSTPQA